MKILDVSPALPVPATSGGSIRVLNLARELSRTDVVDILGIAYVEPRDEDMQELRRYCRNVHLVPWARRPKWKQASRLLRTLLAGEPFSTKYSQVPGFDSMLRELTQRERYDVIVFERTPTAVHLASLPSGHGARTVLSMHDVESIQFGRMCRRQKNPYRKLKLLLTWLPMRKWEPRIAAEFDTVLTVSEHDETILRTLSPRAVTAVVPNGVDTARYRAVPRADRSETALFVGSMDYDPNVDAVLHFCRATWPLIRAELPDTTFTAVGREPPQAVAKLDGSAGIRVTGEVDDVRPFYGRAAVAVVPLMSGGGTRIKILEAMASGTPVVSTTLGCEGLDVRAGEHLLVADSPADFARAVSKLMADACLWDRIATNGRQLVESRYDWRHSALRERAVFERLLQGTPP